MIYFKTIQVKINNKLEISYYDFELVKKIG